MSMNVLEHAVPAVALAIGMRLALDHAPWMPRTKSVIALIVAVLALVPSPYGSLTGIVLSLFGAPSAASIVLVALQAPRLWSGGAAARMPSTTLLAGILVSGALLYPSAAGAFLFDVYALGYRGLAVAVLMAAYVAVGWATAARDVAWWIGGAGLLFLLHPYASHNAWDYLIDPFAVIAAAAILAARLGMKIVKREAPAQ